MALSFPPQLTGENSRDILVLQSYLYDLLSELEQLVLFTELQELSAGQLLLGRETDSGSIEEIGLQPALHIESGQLGFVADTGWSTTGLMPDKALASGDTLLQTQQVLATLIQTLIAKGLLSA